MRSVSSYHLFCAALIAGCFFLYGCENDRNKVNKLDAQKISVEEARQIKLNYTIGGKVRAVLTSPVMLNVQDIVPYMEFPKTIHADFYNDSGKVESYLDARYAKYEQNKSVVYMRDSVRVINLQKGDTLYCNELYWDRNKTNNEFYTEKPVRIRTRNEWINGTGMEASQDFSNWHILHSAGVIGVPASKFPE
jgi:LPS export ABC transporter protein LptC